MGLLARLFITSFCLTRSLINPVDLALQLLHLAFLVLNFAILFVYRACHVTRLPSKRLELGLGLGLGLGFA